MATIFVTEATYQAAKSLSLSTGKSMSEIIGNVIAAVEDAETETIIEENKPTERPLTIAEKARLARLRAMERIKGNIGQAIYNRNEGEERIR